MSGYEEYADAQARADDGQPAQPGDPEAIAAGDERLGWEQARYEARRHDEAIEEMVAPDPDGTVYVVMSPRRFVTELVVYAGPADRAEELTELAEAHCPRTGHVYSIDGQTAARLLYGRPDQAYGHEEGEDWYEPSEEEVAWHYGHARQPVPSCPACHPIRLPWRDRLVARCVAAMDERAASRRPPGRPPVGGPINTRLTPEQLAEVDARAAAAGVTRAEMIRRLVEAGLTHAE